MREKLKGKPLADIATSKDHGRVVSNSANLPSAGAILLGEVGLVREDGGFVHTDISVSPVGSLGSTALPIARDATRRMLSEQYMLAQNATTRGLVQTPDFEAAGPVILDAVLLHLGFKAAALGLRKGKTGGLVCLAFRSSLPLPEMDSDQGWSAAHDPPIRVFPERIMESGKSICISGIGSSKHSAPA